jgi:hypothetical protein
MVKKNLFVYMRFSLADTNMHSMADKVVHAVLEAAAGLSVILQPSTGFHIQLSKGVLLVLTFS